MRRERLLRVAAPHFVAGAVWQRDGAGWCCIEAAPILHWLVGRRVDGLADYFVRKGWAWQWLDVKGVQR